MPNHFQTVLDGVKATADGLIAANDGLIAANVGLIAANVGIKQMVDAIRLAHEEYVDRGDSIAHLQALVLELVAEVRHLRDRLEPPPP